MMNSRERVKLALNFHPVDRPLIDLGSTRVSGISGWIYRDIKKRLGIHDDLVNIYDLSAFCAEVEQEVLDRLGADFIMLPLQKSSLDLSCGKWKNFSFWDGNSYLVPQDFNPRVQDDGTLLCGHGYPWTKVEREMPPGCRYFERTEYPDISSIEFEIPHIDPEKWSFAPAFTEEFLAVEQRNAEYLYKNTDKAIVASVTPEAFGVPHGHGGTIGWSMKMQSDPSYAEDYMMLEAEALGKRAEEYIQAAGKYIDVLVISHIDFGTQQSEIFNPDLFKEFFLPAWKYLTGIIHKLAPRLKIFIHSCGAVHELLPMFIEAGIDIYNPVQWTAAGMERENLQKEFGGRIAFWGGAVNTQKTFIHGNPDCIAAETRDTIRILGRNYAYVVNAGHNIQADVPVENILTMYTSAADFRYE